MAIPNITEAELEILRFLWANKQGTVREVHEHLSDKKEAGYTTTLKQMQIMLEKGLLTRDDAQRQHVYKPNVAEEKVRVRVVDKFISTFFKGSASDLILHALGSYKTSPEELKAIASLINKVKKQQP